MSQINHIFHLISFIEKSKLILDFWDSTIYQVISQIDKCPNFCEFKQIDNLLSQLQSYASLLQPFVEKFDTQLETAQEDATFSAELPVLPFSICDLNQTLTKMTQLLAQLQAQPLPKLPQNQALLLGLAGLYGLNVGNWFAPETSNSALYGSINAIKIGIEKKDQFKAVFTEKVPQLNYQLTDLTNLLAIIEESTEKIEQSEISELVEEMLQDIETLDQLSKQKAEMQSAMQSLESILETTAFLQAEFAMSAESICNIENAVNTIKAKAQLKRKFSRKRSIFAWFCADPKGFFRKRVLSH